jgi:hypothetical protein
MLEDRVHLKLCLPTTTSSWFLVVTLEEIVEAEKSLSGVQKWIRKEPNQLSMVCALEVDGITMASVQLRMRALEEEPDRAVMIQLEYNPPKGRGERLVRVEWRPLSPHTNNNKAPEPYRLAVLGSSHIHRFGDNYHKPEGRMLRGNLPHAIPLEPDLPSFSELLTFTSKELNILNLNRVATPPWQTRMV